jgi:putative hydrolase of the HAD superfamily
MKLPAREECFQLFGKYKTPKNIVRHSITVNKVAVYLAEKLKSAGEEVDADAVDRASLLHDIGRSVTGPEKHNEKGFEILKSEGFEELGEIVRKHRLDFISKPNQLSTWEEKLVYYADKRVNESEIVSLDERIEFLKKKYSKYAGEIEKMKPLIETLEKEIFRRIREPPESVNNL